MIVFLLVAVFAAGFLAGFGLAVPMARSHVKKWAIYKETVNLELARLRDLAASAPPLPRTLKRPADGADREARR